MQVLSSYVCGAWKKGDGPGQVLVNPATEEPIAETSTRGLDLAAALAFSRNTGGPALRALSFAARGEILRAMSRIIHQHRDHLLDVAMDSGGVTRSDAKFDVDGASGTLAYYADLGKELGDKKHLADGEAVQLGRSPRFVGQHLLLPRRGVALHVNAFNFPAWGFGEKAACALLAGMPVFVKPATSTALLAHRIFELLVEANVAPAGVLSLLSGPAGDLVKHLSGEDVLAFTGGGSTAAELRAIPAVVRESVRVNVEADSLNAAILGTDVEEGSDTYNAFLRDVVRDITQKSGQKCTAIRRVFVPKERAGAVVDEIVERLRGVVTGNPRAEKVTMGPVATASQLRDVRAGLEKLKAESRLAIGDGPFEPVGAPAGKGFYVQPTLFVQDTPANAKVAHEHEVFGPAATVFSYGSTDEAIREVRRGGGGLVSSVYADDRAVAADLVLGIGSAHGRVVALSAKIVDQTPGPGTVLPQSVHGGPGRAGGGEELGGLRGLGFYSQRVAVQGDRPFIDGLVK